MRTESEGAPHDASPMSRPIPPRTSPALVDVVCTPSTHRLSGSAPLRPYTVYEKRPPQFVPAPARGQASHARTLLGSEGFIVRAEHQLDPPGLLDPARPIRRI